MPKRDLSAVDPRALLDPEVACCAGCAKLEAADAATVVLLSGQVVCNACPAWLIECGVRELDARRVLRMPDKAARYAHLDRREAEFGAEYRARLHAVVLDLWARRKAAAAPDPEPEPADA